MWFLIHMSSVVKGSARDEDNCCLRVCLHHLTQQNGTKQMLGSNQSHHIICFIFLSYIILLHHYLCQGGYTFICSSVMYVMYCITTAYTYFKVSGSRNCMKDSLSLLGGGLHCASAVLLFFFFFPSFKY